MRFGVSLEPPRRPGDGEAWAVAAARDAERLGFDHVLMSGHLLANPLGAATDPLILLAAVAGATTRIGVATSVLVLPYYHPVLLAAQVASLDAVSGGRLALGVGTGWNPAEFAALGVPVRSRGRRTDDSLEIMRALWSGTAAGLPDRFAALRTTALGVRPARPGGPPIWVGGHSEAALRRAARFGAGWHGSGITADEARGFRARLDEHSSTVEMSTVGFLVPPGCTPAGPVPGRLLGGGPGASAEAVIDDLGRLAGAGVAMVSLWMPVDGARLTEALEWFTTAVRPHIRIGRRPV